MYGEYGQGASNSLLGGMMYCAPPPDRDPYNGQMANRDFMCNGHQMGLPASDRDVMYSGQMADRDRYSGRPNGPAANRKLFTEAERNMYNEQIDIPVAGRDLYNGQVDVPAVASNRDLYSENTMAKRSSFKGPADAPPAVSASGDLYNGQNDVAVGERKAFSGQTVGTMAERELYSGPADVKSEERKSYNGQTEVSLAGDVTPPHSPPSLPHFQCMRCKETIREQSVILVNDGRFLHEDCLWCEACRHPIRLVNNTGKMYLRDNKPYCDNDYQKLYGSDKRKRPCCNRCSATLDKGIWVRRADNYMFHVTCFCCSKCDRQLSQSDHFMMREGRVVCDKHFHEHDGSCKDESPKPRAKRMRTSFTEEQVRILQQHFAIDSNPDGQDLERIAKATGLKKRVTQVWFQNNRARHKKSLMQSPGAGGGAGGQQAGTPSLPSSFSPPMSTSTVYASTSEEGDSGQGVDRNIFGPDLDHPEDTGSGGGGGGVAGGGGGGHHHVDFTQQPFCQRDMGQRDMSHYDQLWLWTSDEEDLWEDFRIHFFCDAKKHAPSRELSPRQQSSLPANVTSSTAAVAATAREAAPATKAVASTTGLEDPHDLNGLETWLNSGLGLEEDNRSVGASRTSSSFP